MNNYQAIFSDIDGTLLNSDHQVTPVTCQALKQVTDSGMLLTLISARSPAGIEPIVRKNHLHCHIAAFNGALILDENCNILYENGMSRSCAESVISYLEMNHFPVAWNIFTATDWIVKDRKDPRIMREEHIVEAQATEGDIHTISEETAVDKILFICAPGTLHTVQSRLLENFPELTIAASSDILLEITQNGVDKAHALKQLCSLCNIKPADCIAFGDNYNDVEMLKTAGLGIVMGNAPEEIKEQIGHITADNNHDGIAQALNTYCPDCFCK